MYIYIYIEREREIYRNEKRRDGARLGECTNYMYMHIVAVLLIITIISIITIIDIIIIIIIVIVIIIIIIMAVARRPAAIRGEAVARRTARSESGDWQPGSDVI